MWNEVNITERTNKIMKKVSKKGVTFMKFKTLQVITAILITTLALTLSISAIGKNHWAVDYVDFTYNTGILSDTRSGVGTSETITRGEMANAIVKIEGLTLSNNVSTGFSDIAAGDGCAGAVRWASTQGIITGYSDGTFKPNDPIKRQDCAYSFS
ncbi:MAG: S-layer homology domain-containing protein [Clostridia bacterium]|nr:S-layer homology domain-containing protein [Clostridia bacterium]